MNVCIHGFVGTDCPYCRTDTTIAKGKLANKINMSTQWHTLGDLPPDEQPVWYRYKEWPSERPTEFMVFRRKDYAMGALWNFIWFPAEPPPAPPDESLAAFEEWWKGYKVPDSNPYSPMKTAANNSWNAALAWHKNKTKE